jgi:hypothetical protein
MSRRAKVVNLYNKNHIIVSREDFVSNMYSGADMKTCSISLDNLITPVFEREVKKKSPLGFYYMSIEKYGGEKNVSGDMTEIRINLANKNFKITYPIRVGQSRVDVDNRPWYLYPGEKGMDDHFVTDLIALLNKIYSLAEDEKVDMSKIRKVSFTELFGYPDGPKFQTDAEKILSHGFDPVESFRKRGK